MVRSECVWCRRRFGLLHECDFGKLITLELCLCSVSSTVVPDFHFSITIYVANSKRESRQFLAQSRIYLAAMGAKAKRPTQTSQVCLLLFYSVFSHSRPG